MSAGIIDVCEYPVNEHLSDKERLAEAVVALEGEFFERLDNLKPANAILLGSQRKGKYAYEVRLSLPTCIERILRNSEPIPLPHQGHFEQCWRGIHKCVMETRKERR